jgi:hypothetical protein
MPPLIFPARSPGTPLALPATTPHLIASLGAGGHTTTRGDHREGVLTPRRVHGPARPFSALGQAGTMRPWARISPALFISFQFRIPLFLYLFQEIFLNFQNSYKFVANSEKMQNKFP